MVLESAELLLQAWNYPGAGTTWPDESGNGHNFAINGGVQTTWDGFRFFFDGVSGGGDYMNLPDNPVFDSNDTDFTVVFMILYPTGTPSGNDVILGKKADLGVGSAGWVIWGSALTNIRSLTVDTVATAANISLPAFTANVISVGGMSRNTATNQFTTYVNGTSLTDADIFADLSNAQPFRIGAEGGGFNNFGGYMYAVAYWTSVINMATAEAELRANLYAAQNPPTGRTTRSPRYGLTRLARR